MDIEELEKEEMRKERLENWVVDLMRLCDRVEEKGYITLPDGKKMFLSSNVDYARGDIFSVLYGDIDAGEKDGLASMRLCSVYTICEDDKEEALQQYHDDVSDILLGNADIFLSKNEEGQHIAKVEFPLREQEEKEEELADMKASEYDYKDH